jgi:hypothetical protein
MVQIRIFSDKIFHLVIIDKVSNIAQNYDKCYKYSIAEFIRHNIIEFNHNYFAFNRYKSNFAID